MTRKRKINSTNGQIGKFRLGQRFQWNTATNTGPNLSIQREYSQFKKSTKWPKMWKSHVTVQRRVVKCDFKGHLHYHDLALPSFSVSRSVSIMNSTAKHAWRTESRPTTRHQEKELAGGARDSNRSPFLPSDYHRLIQMKGCLHERDQVTYLKIVKSNLTELRAMLTSESQHKSLAFISHSLCW